MSKQSIKKIWKKNHIVVIIKQVANIKYKRQTSNNYEVITKII
jgi:hypothetical protein